MLKTSRRIDRLKRRNGPASCGLKEGTSLQNTQEIHVSVIVPCRNEIQHIREFLGYLLRQELDTIATEILIVDGMSADGTRDVLDEFEMEFSAIRVLDNIERTASAGLNRGIREAQGEIVIRMDVHTAYAADYVRSCIDVLNETGADNVGGPALTRAHGYVAQAIAQAFHSSFASGGAKFRDPRYEGSVNTVPYGCWRKSTLERIGMFDEELVRGQDDELNFRIVSSGGMVWQSPRIISWYTPRASLSALFLQYFQNGFWKVAAVRKHGRPASWRNLVPVSCLVLGVGLLLCAAGASVSGFRAWRNAFLAVWLALAGLYFAASLVSAFSAARRMGWKFLPFLPVVFAVGHFSYALGFLIAILYRPVASNRSNRIHRAGPAFTK